MNTNATHRNGMLNTKQLKVDMSYQRPIDARRVKKIAENFNPLKVNPIKVSHRDGAYWIFDGQHTTRMLLLRNGNEDLMVECIIYEGLTRQDEAELFARQGEFVRNVKKNAEMKALYVAGDFEISELKSTLESIGFIFDFSESKGDYRIVCCSTIYNIFMKSRISDFTKLMECIKECWNGSNDSLRREIINGMWIFMKTYPDIDAKILIAKLSKVSPVEIYRDGKVHKEIPGDTKYAWVIANAYNKGNRTRKVDITELVKKS